MNNRFEVKCHVVSEAVNSRYILNTYFGHAHPKLAFKEQCMQESGILKMYEDYKLFFSTLKFKKGVVLMEEAAEGRETPFAMTDWKIISIFLVWVSLLTINLFVFSIELVSIKVIGKSQLKAFIIKSCMSTFLSFWYGQIVFLDFMLFRFKSIRIFKLPEYW